MIFVNLILKHGCEKTLISLLLKTGN